MNFQNAAFEFAVGTPSGLPFCSLPEIVFSGRSNVGKSSMINRLVSRRSLARTSSSPGKTATINFYRLGFCRFVDLPGYGYAKVSKADKARWAELVEGYFSADRDIRLVVQIIDMRHQPTEDDWGMINYLQQEGIPFLVVASKGDKLGEVERASQETSLTDLFSSRHILFLPFSARTGEGAERLCSEILSHCRK
jgi:GTP-binding protein